MNNNPLIIVGASARAAAFSAYRAGYLPYWLDQFGDTDLRQRFPGRIISAYPCQAVELIERAPPAPFIYTGALENHPGVLAELCRHRTLAGNPPPVCIGVKDPFRLFQVLRRHRVPCPGLHTDADVDAFTGVRDWLVKPRSGAGGMGIRRHEGGPVKDGYFLQQYLPGESYSAVYVAGAGSRRLLGVTRQLVGMQEFHADEFSYCGSIGPLELDDADRERWGNIGAAVAAGFELRGLFGVDAIRHDGEIYPVEVNPRYTASVEPLELALGIQALALHCNACQGGPLEIEARAPQQLIGKAILFAPENLVFREFVPEGFSMADVPAPGAETRQGRPLLTILVTGPGIDPVREKLKRAAARVFRNLEPGYK